MQRDGNLVLKAPGNQPIWDSRGETPQQRIVAGSVLFMQQDGNLVVRAPGNEAVWASGTGRAGSVLNVQNDGKIVMYAPGNTFVWERPLPPPRTRLVPGESLGPDQALWSPDGRFSLWMQRDGNLVLKAPGNQPIWDSRGETPQQRIVAGSVLFMQQDGNLVVRAPGNEAVWASGTGRAGSVLNVQNDGKIVMYAPGNTFVWERPLPPPTPPGTGTPVRVPCLVGIEPDHGRGSRTRDRVSFPPRPGYGCVRINLFIAAGKIDGLGYGNDRDFNVRANSSTSKGSIWINFETGVLQVVSNKTRVLIGPTFNALPTNAAFNPDLEAARRMSRCLGGGATTVLASAVGAQNVDQWLCVRDVRNDIRLPNFVGMYTTPSRSTYRIRYHLTNSANIAGPFSPSAIDGVLELRLPPVPASGPIHVTGVNRDRFPSIEVYHDYTVRNNRTWTNTVYRQREGSPRDLDADAPKDRAGSYLRCIEIARGGGSLAGATVRGLL